MKSSIGICVILSTVLALGTSLPPYRVQRPGFYHEQPKFYQQPPHDWTSHNYHSQQGLAYPGAPATNIQHIQTYPGHVNTFSTGDTTVINSKPQGQHHDDRLIVIRREGRNPITYKLPVGQSPENLTIIHLKGNEMDGFKDLLPRGNANRGPQETFVQNSAQDTRSAKKKSGPRPVNKKQKPRNRAPVPSKPANDSPGQPTYKGHKTQEKSHDAPIPVHKGPARTPAMSSYNAKAIESVAVESSGDDQTVEKASKSSDNNNAPVFEDGSTSNDDITVPASDKLSPVKPISSKQTGTSEENTHASDKITPNSKARPTPIKQHKPAPVNPLIGHGTKDSSTYAKESSPDYSTFAQATAMSTSDADSVPDSDTDITAPSTDPENGPSDKHYPGKPIPGKQTHILHKNTQTPVKPTPNKPLPDDSTIAHATALATSDADTVPDSDTDSTGPSTDPEDSPSDNNDTPVTDKKYPVPILGEQTHTPYKNTHTPVKPTPNKPLPNDSSFAHARALATSDADSVPDSDTDSTAPSSDPEDGPSDNNDTPVTDKKYPVKPILGEQTYTPHKNTHTPVKPTPNKTLPNDYSFARATALASSDADSVPDSDTDSTAPSSDPEDGPVDNNDTPVPDKHYPVKTILDKQTHTPLKNTHVPNKPTPNSKGKPTPVKQHKPAHGKPSHDADKPSPDDSTLATSDADSVPDSDTDSTAPSSDPEDGPSDNNDTPVPDKHYPVKTFLAKQTHTPLKNTHVPNKPTPSSKGKPTPVDQHKPAHIKPSHDADKPSPDDSTFAQDTESDDTAPDYLTGRDDAPIAPAADSDDFYSPINKKTNAMDDNDDNNNNDKQSNPLKRVDDTTPESDEWTPTESPNFLTTLINLFKGNKNLAHNARPDDLSDKPSTEQMSDTTEKSGVGNTDDEDLSAIAKDNDQDDTDENVEGTEPVNQDKKKSSKKKLEDEFIKKHTYESDGADYDKTDALNDAKTETTPDTTESESDIVEKDKSLKYISKTKHEQTVYKDEVTDTRTKHENTKTKHKTSNSNDDRTAADAVTSERSKKDTAINKKEKDSLFEDQKEDPPLTLLGFLYNLFINANQGKESVNKMFENKRVKEFLKHFVPFSKTD